MGVGWRWAGAGPSDRARDPRCHAVVGRLVRSRSQDGPADDGHCAPKGQQERGEPGLEAEHPAHYQQYADPAGQDPGADGRRAQQDDTDA